MGSEKAECCTGLQPSTILALLCCNFVLQVQVNAQTPPACTFNVTSILDAFPDFFVLNELLTSTGVADEINGRQSLTLLAVTNDVLAAYIASRPHADLADLLRYHVLLEFFKFDDLLTLDTVKYGPVATLLLTTGGATYEEGMLKFHNNLPSGIFISRGTFGESASAAILTNITSYNYDISIMKIDRVLVPVASEFEEISYISSKAVAFGMADYLGLKHAVFGSSTCGSGESKSTRAQSV